MFTMKLNLPYNGFILLQRSLASEGGIFLRWWKDLGNNMRRGTATHFTATYDRFYWELRSDVELEQPGEM